MSVADPFVYRFNKVVSDSVAIFNMVSGFGEKIAKAWTAEIWKRIQDLMAPVEYTPAPETIALFEYKLTTMLKAAAGETVYPKLAQVMDNRVARLQASMARWMGTEQARNAILDLVSKGKRVDLARDVRIAGKTMLERLEGLAEEIASKTADVLREKWAANFAQGLYLGRGAAEAAYRAATDAGLTLTKKEWYEAIGDKIPRRLAGMASDYMAAAIDGELARLHDVTGGEVVGFQWVAIMDRRVCPACAALDGKRWYYNHPNPEFRIDKMPPLPHHPNCRCTKVPILATDKEIGGPDTTTLRTWFEQLPDEDKLHILGRQRYELYKTGVPLSDLIDERGRLRPLEELRAELAEWQKAKEEPGVFQWSSRYDYISAMKEVVDFRGALRAATEADEYVREVVDHFQGFGYTAMNDALFGKYIRDPDAMLAAKEMARWIYDTPEFRTVRPVMVYRGQGAYVGNEPVRPGVYLRSKGFLCTSLNPAVAQGFAAGGGNTIWEIKLPAGCPALPITMVTGDMEEEYELTLPPGVVLKVLDVSKKGDMTYVKAIVAAWKKPGVID